VGEGTRPAGPLQLLSCRFDLPELLAPRPHLLGFGRGEHARHRVRAAGDEVAVWQELGGPDAARVLQQQLGLAGRTPQAERVVLRAWAAAVKGSGLRGGISQQFVVVCGGLWQFAAVGPIFQVAGFCFEMGRHTRSVMMAPDKSSTHAPQLRG
jgi:hypothetical protein